jgi:hypothetical protein
MLLRDAERIAEKAVNASAGPKPKQTATQPERLSGQLKLPEWS